MKSKIITMMLVAMLVFAFAGCGTEEGSDGAYDNNTQQTEQENAQDGEIVTITGENFSKEVLQSDKVVLIDFWASWCGPCQVLSPTIEKIAKENPDIKVGKVNIDEQGGLASMFSVTSIPTLIVFKDGQVINRAAGVMPEEEILDMLK